MESRNPTFNENVFLQPKTQTNSQVMTLEGTVAKSFVLLTLLVFSGAIAWPMAKAGNFIPILFGAMVAGFVVAIITIFTPKASPVLAPVYAILEGVVLGGLSALMESAFPGIVVNAVVLTVGVFAIMLFSYANGLIKVTERFQAVVFSATMAVCLLYLGEILLMMITGATIPMLHDGGLLCIGFSIVVVVIAAANLALDFHWIDEGVRKEAPRYMEWYFSFGMLVTLVWLYLEILELLSYVSD